MTRSGRRWGRGLLIAGIVAGVCAGAAELALRLIVPQVIAGEVRESMRLEADHEVTVSLGGSALLAALQGNVAQVSVSVLDAPLLAGITGDVQATADSLPFSVTSGEIQGATVSVTVREDQLSQVVQLLTDGLADSATVTDGVLAVSHTVSLLGMTVPLEARVQLGVADGNVSVQPVGVTAGDWQLTAEQIRAATGSLLNKLLLPHEVCVSDQLPVGVTLTRVELLKSGGVQVQAQLSPTLFSDPDQQVYGHCVV